MSPEDAILLEALILGMEDPRAERPRPGPYTIAIFVERNWITLRWRDDGALDIRLTRAGTRELEVYRRRQAERREQP